MLIRTFLAPLRSEGVSPMIALLVLLLVVGCTPAPPRPTEAERAAAFHRGVMEALRGVEAYCATRPDPGACERAVLEVLSRPVILPPEPVPPQTIIIQQPRPRERRYQGPRTIHGVPIIPGVVPVYPVE